MPLTRHRISHSEYIGTCSTSSGARATFRHHARAEEALQYSSLIATEELTELLKPASTVPLYQYIPL